MPAWLNNLTQRHPIFALPPLYDSDSLPQPPSPTFTASNLFSPTNNTHHNSFLSGSKSTKLRSNQPSQTNGLKEESSGKGRRRKERVVLVRGVDLIVAVGKELRIASLVDVKIRSDERAQENEDEGIENVDELELGEYKTLSTPVITFEIRQLVLNATSKLLAVVGLHSIAVVVLPRKGWASTVGHTVECRSLLIGKFYHSLPSSPSVSQIAWHPWGLNSSSLLVLTSDSNFREYSIGEDAEEPAQALSFLKGGSGSREKGRGGFGSDDVDAGVAVGFCLGEGESDWGPMTIHGLMRNGDVVALCPFLPKKASIPASYIHSLSCFVSAKVDYLRTTTNESFSPEESFTALTPYQRTPSKNPFSATSQSSSPHAAQNHTSEPNALSKRYNHQLRYVSALLRQVPTSSTSALSTLPPTSRLFPPSTPSSSTTAATEEETDSSTFISITTPTNSFNSSSPYLQGPFLMQPPPVELENGAESIACDIVYVSCKSAGGSRVGLGVIAVAYSDGKVEMCLEVEKVEAKWGEEEEEDEEEDADSVEEGGRGGPSLAVYETIDLGFLSELEGRDIDEALEGNYPTFVKDPLYDDTVYIYHSLGAHCLSFSRWLESMVELSQSAGVGDGAEEEDEEKVQKRMERDLRGLEGSDVVWILKTLDVSSNGGSTSTPPVVGLVMIHDVYLGYSILLVTSALQAVGIELSLRVDLSLLPSADLPTTSSSSLPFSTGKISTKTSGIASESPAYLSLLDSPFSIPSLLSNPTGMASTVARRVPPPSNSSTKSALVITPDTLRFMGKTVESFRFAIRDLVGAADEVQCRLELQMKELSRQLKKLKELKELAEEGLNKSRNASASTTPNQDGKGISSRLRRVEENQMKLLERTDRVLQRLMESHEPVLSSFEKKWFEELGRVEKEVLENASSGGGGELSLESRAKRIVAQLESLKPALEEIKRKEIEKGSSAVKSMGVNGSGGMGANQMRSLELNLAHESKLIVEARQKLDRLASLLASSSLS